MPDRAGARSRGTPDVVAEEGEQQSRGPTNLYGNGERVTYATRTRLTAAQPDRNKDHTVRPGNNRFSGLPMNW